MFPAFDAAVESYYELQMSWPWQWHSMAVFSAYYKTCSIELFSNRYLCLLPAAHNEWLAGQIFFYPKTEKFWPNTEKLD